LNSSWDNIGFNENLNGLIKQYFTKGSDFTNLINKQIKEVETKLNRSPRERHNYKKSYICNETIFIIKKLHL
jgi:IS30 family transposase